jgi:hypothetical protein
VYESTNSGGSWFPITGSNTKATALVAADRGQVFMLASNGAINQSVWHYGGSPNNWGQPLTDANTTVTALVSTGSYGDLYMLAGNIYSPMLQTVYQRTYIATPIGSGWGWATLTYDVWGATALATNGGNVYMLANFGTASTGVYQYTGSGMNWSTLTGSNTHATALLTSDGNLYMLGSNGPNYQYQTAWQYGGSPYNWTPLTGSDTQVLQLVEGSDSNLYMVATKNYSTEVYEYSGSGMDWGTPLTGPYLQVALSTWQLVLGHPLAAPGLTYSQLNGTLFNTNTVLPSYLDVQQGQVGDCWLMASLAEVAAREPSLFYTMFVYDGSTSENGSTVSVYSVRLYDSYGNARYFTVDTELPSGGTYYDQPINYVLWAALAEKAYVEANGAGFVTSQYTGCNAYSAIAGGHPAWALQAITGQSASSYSINPNDVASAWNAGELVVLCTGNPNSSYIVGSHCYALVNYNPSGSQPFEVYNPWGTASNGWYNGVVNGTYGLFWADASFLSSNFSSQSTGLVFAPDGRKDRHARSSQELADLAFIEDLLDPHAKARRGSGGSPTSAVSVN